jgi:hypothetical protein
MMMATKTGTELKLMLLGDANEMVNGDDYTMDIADIRVGVRFAYAIADPVEPDDGLRAVGRVVTLSAGEIASGLTALQRTALLNLVASKL